MTKDRVFTCIVNVDIDGRSQLFLKDVSIDFVGKLKSSAYYQFIFGLKSRRQPRLFFSRQNVIPLASTVK